MTSYLPEDTNAGLLSLNIVAIPPTPQKKTSQTNPKKRLNKYEKRRRKAANAKAQRSTVTAVPVEDHTRNSTATQDDVNQQPFHRDVSEGQDSFSEDEAVEGAKPVSVGLKLSPLREVDDGIVNHTTLSETDEESEDNPDANYGIRASSLEASDLDNMADPDVETSAVDSLQDEADRAKYLAEFHARPLELDRRSGAPTNGRILPSRESKHLFAEATEWSHLPLHERLIQSLAQFNFTHPTSVQSNAITAFCKQGQLYNLLLQAETGSGKTLAFLLPILQALAVDSEGAVNRFERHEFGTRCIVLSPTRELASQTFTVVEQLCAASFNWLVPGCLFGEERRKSEKARLRKGLGIVVATPGRLLDHLTRTESLLLALKGKLQWLVLDEADRLLDLGLGDQVKQIVQRLRANQPGSGRNGITWRSVLVSATVTPHVETLANETLVGGDNSWVWVQGGTKDNDAPQTKADQSDSFNAVEFAQSTPKQLTQLHLTVSAKLRLPALTAFLVLRAAKQERTVVFLSTCAAVDYYHALFTATESIVQTESEAGKSLLGDCSIYKLHGSIPHGERQQTLRQFIKVSTMKKQAAVLFATDVASRGLNLPDVDWTVQYDPPAEVAEYVHRAGRVARAGRAGHSLLFLLPSERAFLDVLNKRGVRKMSALSLSSTLNAAADVCKDVAADGMRRSGGGTLSGTSASTSSRSGEGFASEVQRRLEDFVASDSAESRGVPNSSSKKRSSTSMGKTPNGLLELARSAFVSHLRAYPTREKVVRHVFSAKSLHLGHVARSFALKEPPKKLANMASKQTAVVLEKNNSRKRNASMAFEAFDDDLESGPSMKRNALPTHNGAKPRSARALLIANATKLQEMGLDGL